MRRFRRWQVDAAITAFVAAAITAIFANGWLDVALTRPFFDASAAEHWPLGRELPWSTLYRAAPWITASLVLGGLFFLGLALLRHNRTLQRQAIFVTLSVVLGPGLLVNGAFKDHWNRPRPRDVIELGGTLHYTPAPLRGEGGKSFPCGHCSVGFLYALGWWIWRRRSRLALASLATGLGVGIALGIGRMAAGGHFPSDIAWSAFISLGIAHWLYWHVLRIPEHEAAREAARAVGRLPQYALLLLAGAGAIGVLTAIFVTARGELVEQTIPFTPQVFEFSAPACDVDIVVVDAATAVRVGGETHGFGLPGSRLVAGADLVASPVPTLRYSVEQRGWFTDFDCHISFELPVANLERIDVRVRKGNLSLIDRTHDRLVLNGKVRADLRTGAGHTRVSD